MLFQIKGSSAREKNGRDTWRDSDDNDLLYDTQESNDDEFDIRSYK